MGFLSSLFDPGNVFGGEDGGLSVSGIFDPGGTILDSVGAMPDFYSNATENVDNWAGNIVDFEKSQLSDWWSKFKNDPTQLLIGAGDPFSAKMWSGITGKDYEPYVNQYGGPTNQAYESAERKGIDTSDSRGSHAVAQTIASLYGGAGAGAGLGAAGSAAGIGAAGGQALGGAALGAGNAWANDGDILQSALAGALPGLGKMFGGALNGVNTGTMGEGAKTAADTFNEYNKATNGVLGKVGSGALQGAIGSGTKGQSMGEGAGQGALMGGLGGLFGQGLQQLGMNTGNGDSLGNALVRGGMGMYAANQAKKDLGGQIGQLQSLFSGNSPYAQQLQQQLARKDAAAGRRSQYGPREVELQARLAELNSRNAPQLNQLYNQRKAENMSQYKDLYNVLRSSGLMEKLGTMGQQYFQGYGNHNQGQIQGPPMASMYEDQEY